MLRIVYLSAHRLGEVIERRRVMEIVHHQLDRTVEHRMAGSGRLLGSADGERKKQQGRRKRERPCSYPWHPHAAIYGSNRVRIETSR